MRVFVAVFPPEECREELARIVSGLRRKLPGAKFVPPENMHFTLKFLGKLGEEDVSAIGERLSEIKFPTFELSVKGFGAFPSTYKPRVIWLGAGKGANELRLLAEEVHRKTDFIPLDKPFSPHLTIARIKWGRPDLRELEKKFSNKVFCTFKVEEFGLYQSILKAPNPEYVPLRKYKLL